MPKAKKARYAFYAVAKGKKGPGVYSTWKETEQQTRKVSGARHQGCDTLEEVLEFFNEHKVDMDKVFWGEGTRLHGDAAPVPGPSAPVVAHSAAQGVAVALAVAAPDAAQTPSLPPEVSAAFAALARAAEALSQGPPRASSHCSQPESSPPPSPRADKALPPLPSSPPAQDDSTEPPKEKENAALLRVRDQIEGTLSALSGRNGDSSEPELPPADLAERMRAILREIDDSLGG
ncbi:hypothetical protein AURDEDRAFT_164359 [Auricularia subglabra TFB-10046 SS5]|nr:hypothetical protein AURDEDRAFT_164359 [Auricularia subglabra TFB-10046 SS5]